MPLSLATVFSCLARTGLVNAAVTTRGMQQIGLAYILAPALRELYPDREARRHALARYAKHTNTHPFAQPFVAGVLIHMEADLANGLMNETGMEKLRSTMEPVLSAVGDSFFSGSLRPAWALACVCLLLNGHAAWAACFTLALFLLLQGLRCASFLYGLREGFPAVMKLARHRPVSWAERVKTANALLAGLALWFMLCQDCGELSLPARAGMAAFLPLAGWVVYKRLAPPALFWIAGLLLLACAGGGALHL